MSSLVPAHLREFPHVGEHNFLINGILVDYLRGVAPTHARGVLADIGCGHKPYKQLFAPYVERHVGVDLATSPQGMEAIDVVGSAYDTTLADASCDTVLCTEVLEHLEEPGRALDELRRVLKPGGHLILTVPFFWHVHEAPRDFYRYSQYGLKYLLERHGFEVVEIRPLTGAVVTLTQLSIYYARSRGPNIKRVLRWPIWAAQKVAGALNGRDRSRGFTNAYGAVARRSP